MRRAGFTTILLMGALLPGGALSLGEHEVHGEVELADPGTWSGLMEVGAGAGGAFNLSVVDDQLPDLVTWTSARGHVVDIPHAGTPLGSGYYHALEPNNTSYRFGAGEVELECLPGCSVLLYAREGSDLRLSGRLAGPLQGAAPLAYFAWNRGPWPDNFYFEAPPGSLVTGGPGWLDGAASAEGALGLFVENATARIVAADGASHVFQLGRSSETLAASPVGPAAEVIHNRFLVLEMEDAAWSAPDVLPFLVAAEARYAFEGELVAREASGTIWADGRALAVNAERILLAGAFEATHRARDATPGLVKYGEAAPPTLTFSGSATRLRIGTEEPLSMLAPEARVGIAWATLGLIALAGIASIPWAPFYSRLDKASVLSNPRRAAIIASLRETPGLTAAELARRLGAARAIILHHVAMLQSHRVVVDRRVGWTTRLYLAEDAPDAAALRVHEALKDPTRRRVAAAVAGGARTQSEVMSATGLPQRLVSYHLSRLRSRALVEVAEVRPRRYAPLPALVAELDRAPAP